MYLRVGAIGEYHVKFLRLATMILEYFRHTRILSNSTVWNRFVYLFICFVHKPNFLPLLKPLKMNSSDFWDIFERTSWYLNCFNGQILLKLGCKPTFLPYNVCLNFLDEGLDVSATKNQIWTTKSWYFTKFQKTKKCY